MSSSTPTGDARIAAHRLIYTLPDGRELFDVTLSFGRERTGLIGPNGSGKTTLVRLLAGELAPVSGTVRRAGVVTVLPQDVQLPPDAPLAAVLGIEECLAALRRMEAGKATVVDFETMGVDWDLPERAVALLTRFGLAHLPLDRPVGAVSGGEASRVALASLLLGRSDFLLLDEPTNHLDSKNRAALYDFVGSWTGGLLCVSHDRALLRRMDRIIELSSTGVRVYGGNYDDYRAVRDAEDAAAERELGSARAALRRAEARAREVRERQARREAAGRRSRTTANMPKILLNARKSRAQSTRGRVDAIAEREVEERRERLLTARQRSVERERPRFTLGTTGLPSGRTVLELDRVTVRFPGTARPLFEGVSLRLTGRERVAVTGPNGSGKTTLLEVVTGRRAPDSGTVRRVQARQIGVLDQHGAGLDGARSVLENHRSFHPELDERAARHALARFLFSHETASQCVRTLSGGERLRAALACVLAGASPPALLVLDEPTNHLDLDAIEALEAALQAYDGALLVVSHDAAFLEAVGVQRELRLA